MINRTSEFIKAFILIVVCQYFFAVTVLAESTWLKVLPGKKLEYPRDHGSHPEYPIEWWYITGHLRKSDSDPASSDEALGFQITFFRVGVESPGGPSRWHSQALMISHSAMSDEKKGEYCSEEHSERVALGMAGAEEEHLNVWVGAQNLEDGSEGWTSTFTCKGRTLALKFRPKKSLVLHGDHGYVQKGAESGDASYYVSYTRMNVSGTSSEAGESSNVTGEAWFDHEIVSSSVGRSDIGWDWFALQLSDNTEVMIYRLRDAKGEKRDFSRGAYVDATGNVTEFSAKQCELTAEDRWRSEVSGSSYPLTWRIQCKSAGINFSLSVKATLPNQEFAGGSATGKRYWEGRVVVEGDSMGHSVTGNGYLEMVNSGE